MSTILIKGGTVVTSWGISRQNVYIQEDKIAEVSINDYHKADLIIDASGLYILPGAVDTHVHFNDEFMGTMSVHDYYTGTLAAAYGGVTSIIDFSNQIPGKPLIHTLEKKFKEAEGKALIDYGIHPVITNLTGKILDEIPVLVEKGAPTIKCYMTYRSEGLMMEIPDLKRILSRLADSGGMLLVHAEDNETIENNVSRWINQGKTAAIFHARSRPPESEYKAILNCIKIAEETGGRLFIVHLSTDKGMNAVSSARKKGQHVYAETCTHYLIFSEERLKREDGIKWICSPPLRNRRIRQKLWEGISDGRISLVSSDDAAYSWKAKLMGKDRFDRCPNGIPGIEPRLNLLYSEGVVKNRITLSRLVELVCTNPAKWFGLWPRKGQIDPGADADIILFDPKKKWIMSQSSLHMASDWSAYEGIEITGKIEKVFSRGELIIDGDKCLARKGRGEYLHRRLTSGPPDLA
ncbi:MAG: dihydropyrimidinase [Candidatus Aminicenantes bacterium]|nr:dihydropyrimidinase [Candidatus Aminicenantes bacterium]